MPYFAHPIPFDARHFATHQSLEFIASFTKDASESYRQKAIDYVVIAHGMSKDGTTKSLLYDATLNQPGRNVQGNIGIGAEAFGQDEAWLSGVVFHELVHSPQNAYYASRGVTQIDPNRSETERRMIALDEYEAYWWSFTRRAELGLSHPQLSEIWRRAQLAFIDLDDSKAKSFAKSAKFDEARDELIRQFNATAANVQMRTSRQNWMGCCRSTT